jgi:hypothetical protein
MPNYIQHDDESYLFGTKVQARQHAEVYRPNYCLYGYNISLFIQWVFIFGLWIDKGELYNATYNNMLSHLVGKTLVKNRI